MTDFFDSIRAVLSRIESYHDSYTMRHEENTGMMMECLAKELGHDEKYCYELRQAGSIHDIGKLALPSQILEKPGALSLFEREIIEMHPIIGGKILEKVNHPLAKLAHSINIYHHESYDGNGYPYKLKADQIPIEARICSVCDVYDAIRAHRPYHSGESSHKEVVQMILSKKSNGLFHKFDPSILDAFSVIHDKFDEIFSSKKQH